MRRYAFTKWLIFPLVLACAALLFFVFVPTVAHAENIGEIHVYLQYNAEPSNDVKAPSRIGNSSKYFKITNFSYYDSSDYSYHSLLGSDNKVAVKPAVDSVVYRADASVVAVACDATGNALEDGTVLTGTVYFEVLGPQLTATLSRITKEYGDVLEKPIWKKDNITVTFASDGLAATAVPSGDYPLTKESVVKNKDEEDPEDVTDIYTITAKMPTLTDPAKTETAKVFVEPKKISVAFATQENVIFNSYTIPNEEDCVAMLEVDGVNDEILTCYFRLTAEDRAKTSLEIGKEYQTEIYKYTVRNAENEEVPTEYYDVSLAEDGITTVRAITGPITLYQTENELYEGKSDYCRLDPSLFTFSYLDPFVKSYDGEKLIFPNILLYGETVELTFSVVDGEAGVLPVGEHKLSFVRADKDEFNDITLAEDNFYLVINDRILDYTKAGEYQYGLPSVSVEAVFDDVRYTFTLRVDTDAYFVGATDAKYIEDKVASDQDAHVFLDCSKVHPQITKRSDGVSFRSTEEISMHYLSAAPIISSLVLDGDEITSEAGHIEYYYSTDGGETFTSQPGLPSSVGEYVIKTKLSEDSYYIATPTTTKLTIEKLPVILVYEVTKVKKSYGELFAFSSNSPKTARLDGIYAYDEESGRSGNNLVERSDIVSSAQGFGITSDGTAEDAEIGEYPLKHTLTSNCFEIRKLFLREINSSEETEVFTVVKGEFPPKPQITCSLSGSGRVLEVRSSANGSVLVQVSKEESFSAKEEATLNKGVASFVKRLYGQVYYVRARVSDSAHYEKDGEWCDSQAVEVPFPALTIARESVGVTEAIFSAEKLPAESAVSYVVEYKVGINGSWKEGLTVQGLVPGKEQNVYFRARAGAVVGAEREMTVTTLTTAVSENDVEISYDRDKMELSAKTAASVEMRLLSRSGDIVFDWTEGELFSDVPRDGEYILQIRNKADGEDSLLTEIAIDTHRIEPVTIKTVLADAFLLFIACFAVIGLVIVVIFFVRVKKKMDKALGGKHGK